MQPSASTDTMLPGISPPQASRLHMRLRRAAEFAVGALLVLLVTGCHHPPQHAYQPPPPPTNSRSTTHTARVQPPVAPVLVPPTLPRDSSSKEANGKPTSTETGMASWYGSGKRAADGSAFDKNAMTAAHKTLPLGTMVRVTNLVNGESVTVKITDRGPFAQGRILDLSEGAARKIDLYRMGVAKVKIEAFAHPSASPVGKWVVQTGAFKTEDDANDLKAALQKRFTTARVIEFPSSTGFWVRIDPPHYDKQQAAAILEWIGKPDDHATPYMVRVD